MTPSNQSTRDAIAGVLGWTRTSDGAWYPPKGHWLEVVPVMGYPEHEVGDSLDATAALWRENLAGWSWWRDPIIIQWRAFRPQAATHKHGVSVPDTGDEKTDRLALLLAALKVEKKQ